MITINSQRFVQNDEITGLEKYIFELFVDDSGELPPAEFAGKIINQGSVALIITESKIAVFGSDGSWYIDGEVIS